MENKIIKKISRFVELSKKFSMDIDDIVDRADYQCEDTNSSTSVVFREGNGGISEWLTGLQRTSEGEGSKPSIADSLMAVAKQKADRVKDFEEYQKLQRDLTKYFEGLNNLILNK